MSFPKIVTGFARLGDDEFGTHAQNILEKMTGNPNFPEPTPPLADVLSGLTTYRLVLAEAKNGGTDRITLKNTKREELDELLKALGIYVQFTCKKDTQMIASSGFGLQKPSARVGRLEIPVNLRVTNGPNLGSVTVSVNRIHGAGTYAFDYAPAPVGENSSWTTCNSRTRIHVIEGLTRGQQYVFRVAGIGAHPMLVYSDQIDRFVH